MCRLSGRKTKKVSCHRWKVKLLKDKNNVVFLQEAAPENCGATAKHFHTVTTTKDTYFLCGLLIILTTTLNGNSAQTAQDSALFLGGCFTDQSFYYHFISYNINIWCIMKYIFSSGMNTTSKRKQSWCWTTNPNQLFTPDLVNKETMKREKKRSKKQQERMCVWLCVFKPYRCSGLNSERIISIISTKHQGAETQRVTADKTTSMGFIVSHFLFFSRFNSSAERERERERRLGKSLFLKWVINPEITQIHISELSSKSWVCTGLVSLTSRDGDTWISTIYNLLNMPL